MANIVEISDLSLPELDIFARLTEGQLRAQRCSLFIAESAKVISCALNAGCEPVALLMEKRQLSAAQPLLALCGDAVVYCGEREVLSRLTGYALTRGFLCAMRRPAPRNAEEICRSARRIAVLEGLTDPTNVGAIFRSAAALGADGVLLTPTCCDPLHRRAARVSMGTVFQVPWARIGERPEDWPQAGLIQLHAWGFKTAAMALSARSIRMDAPELMKEPRLALMLGTEGDGLSAQTVAQCDYTVRIPMARGVDSLNVASAAAVAFWQLCGRAE